MLLHVYVFVNQLEIIVMIPRRYDVRD